MNKYTLVMALATYAGCAHATHMSIEEGRTKVLGAQERYDSIKAHLKQLDADIQATNSKLSNLSISPSNAKEINALNSKFKYLISQRKQLNEQYSKAFDNFRQAIRHVGRKYTINTHNDGKYSVHPRKKNVRPVRGS